MTFPEQFDQKSSEDHVDPKANGRQCRPQLHSLKNFLKYKVILQPECMKDLTCTGASLTAVKHQHLYDEFHSDPVYFI